MIKQDMNVKMFDVARMAGVSQPTVSRVINNSGYVSIETRTRVLKAIGQLNYEPHPAARRLALKLTENIGVIISEPLPSLLHNPYYTHILNGILEVVEETNFTLSLGTIKTNSEMDFNLPLFIKRKDVDGILILGIVSERQLEKIQRSDCPFLLIDNHMLHDGIPAVENDDQGAAYKATKYLIEKGHRKIAFIGTGKYNPIGFETWKGFKRAMAETNIPIHPSHIQEEDISQKGGSIAMNAILKSPIKPTGVFASCDYMAAGCLEVLNTCGIHVPNEIAVIGCDDIEIAKFTNPSLTTVHTNTDEMGKSAAKIIMEMIQGTYEGPIKTVIENYLMKRKSA